MSLKQMRFQVTLKLIRPNSWITQTVRQRIPNCWAHNGESTSAESAAMDAWNNELTATGGSQMLSTRNRGDRHAVIGEVRRGSPSQTTVDHHCQLVPHPLRNVANFGNGSFQSVTCTDADNQTRTTYFSSQLTHPLATQGITDS